MKAKITITKYKPRTLGYLDSKGKYHGKYKVSGVKKLWDDIIIMDYEKAKRIAKARRYLLKNYYKTK